MRWRCIIYQVKDKRGITTYGYDNRNRLTSITPQGAGSPSVSYGYDANSNRTSITTGAGTTTYGYDALNRLQTVGNSSQWGSNTASYSYTPVGTRDILTMPNGVQVKYGYDELNRLTGVTHTVGSNIIGKHLYTLGLAGNRTKVVEAGGNSIEWGYDDAYRLTSEIFKSSAGTILTNTAYTYDAVGNRLSNATTANGGTTTTSYTYNALDQITNTGYVYDTMGNLQQGPAGGGTATYSWNGADQLTSVTMPGGASASYTYDSDGRRVKQVAGSTTTNYIWDESSTYGDVVLETDGSGAIQASYVLGGAELLSQKKGSNPANYFLRDGQGSTRALTNGSGAISESYSFDAFGSSDGYKPGAKSLKHLRL